MEATYPDSETWTAAELHDAKGPCFLPEPELLQRFIHIAALAPSPDNNQPWFFRITGRKLVVCYLRDRALRSDKKDILNYCAIGAALHNLRLAAASEGLHVHITHCFSDDPDAATVAEIAFSKGCPPLPGYHEIFCRHTNRRPYSSRSIPEDVLDELKERVEQRGATVEFAQGNAALRRIGRLVGIYDRVRLSYRPFQEELREVLRFSREEALRRGDGLLVSALELPPGASLMLKMLRSQSVMRLANMFGAARVCGMLSAHQARSSAAIGLLSVFADEPNDFVRAGEAFQDLWLQLTAAGISLHPLGAYPVFQVLAADPGCALPGGQWSAVAAANTAMEKLFPESAGGIPVMLFRLGYAAPPKAVVAYRFPQNKIADTAVTDEEKETVFKYKVAFSRNIGLVRRSEQEKLRHATVALPGLGGVGGIHLLTLSRMGIGGFHLAEFDAFDLANFNRQHGATMRTLHRPKLDVMADMARDINPGVRVRCWSEGVSEENVDGFLEGANVVVDGIDAFNIEARRVLFRRARERGVTLVSAGPIGFSCAMVIFTPDGMTFDDYFGLSAEMENSDMFLPFIVGLVPGLEPFSYINLDEVNSAERRGPSCASAVALCAGFAATEVLKIVLDRKPVFAAPYYHYFDPYLSKFKRGKLPLGNRGPLQRSKLRLLARRLRRMGHK